MKNGKKKFVGVGKIEANGNYFKEFGWAFNEGQFRAIINARLKKRHPNIKVYPINFEVRDITSYKEEEVKICTIILATKTK